MKGCKYILSIIAFLLAVSAAVIAVITYKDQIIEFFGNAKEILCPFCREKAKKSDEFSDFADV